jgi:hypothetical protein
MKQSCPLKGAGCATGYTKVWTHMVLLTCFLKTKIAIVYFISSYCLDRFKRYWNLAAFCCTKFTSIFGSGPLFQGSARYFYVLIGLKLKYASPGPFLE